MRRLLLMLVLFSLLHAGSLPLHSSSYANAVENRTVYTFRTQNIEDFPTSAFRIHISSDFSWFDPASFTYPMEPDYMDANSAYWDIPPLLPNETAEVSFTVERLVGLPEEIDVWSEDIGNWSFGCAYLESYNSTATTHFLIRDFLDATNRSQGATIYFEDGGLALVKLDGYNSFAVFSVDESGAHPVSNRTQIDAIVDAYVLAGSPEERGDVSALHKAILNTKSVKYKAEHECYLLTGMAEHPCVDHDTCLYACFSVPVCSLVGQSGWDFMDTILDYNISATGANKALGQAEASSYMLSLSPDYFTAKKSFEDLVRLNRAEGAVMFHPLIASYGFCEPPNYGLPVQISARRQLLDYLGSTCLVGEGERIKDEAARVAPLLQPRPQHAVRNETEPEPEEINITQNRTFEIAAPAQDAYSCCYGGACSLLGFERLGGLCWEWYVLFIPFAAILIFAAWKASG
jgi:hypothetical protein